MQFHSASTYSRPFTGLTLKIKTKTTEVDYSIPQKHKGKSTCKSSVVITYKCYFRASSSKSFKNMLVKLFGLVLRGISLGPVL